MRSASLLLLISLYCSTASAAIIQFRQGSFPDGAYQSIDSLIRNDQTTSNYGARTSLIVGRTATATIRSVFGFDLSAIPANSTITNVTFGLVGSQEDTGSVDGAQTFELRSLNSLITEGVGTTDGGPDPDVTWNNSTTATPWTTAGGDLGSLLSMTSIDTGSLAGGTPVMFGSTPNFLSTIQSIADANGTFYFTVKGDSTVESTATRRVFFVHADEASTATNRPLLTIEYTPVPEPSSYAVCALIVAAGLCAWRRDKNPNRNNGAEVS